MAPPPFAASAGAKARTRASGPNTFVSNRGERLDGVVGEY